jgi:hypothetical protein
MIVLVLWSDGDRPIPVLLYVLYRRIISCLLDSASVASLVNALRRWWIRVGSRGWARANLV